MGDTVKIRFRNCLSRRLSIHVQGLSYDVNTSDGSSVGYNNDTTTREEICYTWYADTEGVYLFHDMADPRNSEDATNIHGLFGAVIVEAPGAQWYRNFTGKKDSFAQQAVITAPGVESFREYVLFIPNGIRLLDKNGNLIETAVGDDGEPIDAEDTGETDFRMQMQGNLQEASEMLPVLTEK